MDRIEIRCTNAPAVDGRRRRRGERRRRRRRRRDASRRRRDVFSSIASSRRLSLTRVASSPLTRFNPPIIVSRSYLSRANARHAPARARRRRRRGRARPWTPFRRIRSNPRERRRAWWICRSFVARASSVVARSFLGARAASLSSSPANVLARGDDPIPRPRRRRRVDDARARGRDGSESRMKRNSLISNHPSDVPSLAPRARRASSRSRPIDRATLSRSFASSSIARLPRRLPTAREREAREAHTHAPLGGLRRLEGANVTENGGLRDGRHGRARARVTPGDARGRRSIDRSRAGDSISRGKGGSS